MTEVVQLSDYRRVTTRRPGKRVKKKSTRPQNALSSADRAELDERINKVAARFDDEWLVKNTIRQGIRNNCGVARYYHITPSQMTSYINELHDLDYKAYVFQKLRFVLSNWRSKNVEKIFVDCGYDIDRFIERVIE
ncbi:MAG: hypothetical protein AB2745_08415 [Candidatus Thiodiazotropha endolucinida]